MTVTLNQWDILDPFRMLKDIEAAHGSAIFDRWAYLDPTDAAKQLGSALGVTVSNAALLDPARFVSDVQPHLGGAYVAKAVHFDGAAWLSIASLTASGDASGHASFSTWIKVAGGAQQIWTVDPANTFTNNMQATFDVGPNVTEALAYFANADGSSHLSLAGAAGNPIDGVWVNILGSVQTDFASGSKVAQLYVNDVDAVGIVGDAQDSFTMVWNGLPFFLGADTFGDNFTGDMADFWLAPGTLVDFSVQANRRKFINASGKPVDPSGFPAGAILFSGDSTTFATNQGTGGAFTLTGSLTNASTSPSD